MNIGRRLYEKRVKLVPYEIGMMRLGEVHLSASWFSREDIERIGEASIWREHCVIGRVRNEWVVWTDGERPVRFRAHYVVKGKRVVSLAKHRAGTFEQQMDIFESRDNSRPVDVASHEEIFAAGKGQRTRKKAKVGANRVIGKRSGMYGRIVARPYCV